MVQVESHYSVEDTQADHLQRLAGNVVPDPPRDTSTSSERKVIHDAGHTEHGNERQRNEDEVTRVHDDEDRDTDNEIYDITTEQQQQHQNEDPRAIGTTTDSEPDNRDKEINEKNLLIQLQEEHSTQRMEKNSDLEVMLTSGSGGGSGGGDDDDDGIPDGGWGYMVVLGTFIIVNSAGITSACFGILFLDFLNQLGTSTTTVATIFNIESFLWSCANLLGGPLTEVVGWRCVAMAGALLNALGLALSAFATSASFLFFSHSIMTGLGSGLGCLVAFAIIPFYFKKRRGRANGLMMAGMCTGGMFWPSIITYLQEEYGYKGATLITAAFMLNNCVAASVFHPVEWHRRKPKNTISSHPAKCSSLPSNEDIGKKPLCGGIVSKVCKDEQGKNEKNTTQMGLNGHTVSQKENVVTLRITYFENVNDRKVNAIQKCKAAEQHQKNRRPGLTTNTQTNTEQQQKNKSGPGIASKMKEVVLTLVTNIKVLKSPTAIIISIGVAFFVGVYLNFVMITPFAMDAMGYTQEEISWSLGVSNLCNLVSRLVVSSLADLPGFSIVKMFMAGTATLGIAAIGFCLVDGLVLMSVMLGVWGCGVGTCNSLYTLLLAQCMGLSKYMAMLGVSGVISGVWMLASGPLYGMVRDLSGSYTVTICALASMALLTIVLFLFLPAAMRYDRRKAEEEKKREKEEIC